MAWPGQLPEGARCDVISSLDLNATMIDALNCPELPHSRGQSLLPLLTDPENAEWDNVAFSEFCQNKRGGGGEFPEEGVYHRMVRRETLNSTTTVSPVNFLT